MKTWTVQCGYAAYYANTVTVEAETLDQALDKAIEAANDDPCWKTLDDCGPTFIDAVAEGADADPWAGLHSAIPVSPRFTERGEPPLTTVIIEGGAVQDVRIESGSARVRVHDYDTESMAPGDPGIRIDEQGRRFALAEWIDEFPP
jgi:hypothetical protein